MSIIEEMRQLAFIMLLIVASFFTLALAGLALVGIVGGLLTLAFEPAIVGTACAACSAACCYLAVFASRSL